MYQKEVIDEVRERHAKSLAVVQRITSELEEARREEKLWADFERYLVLGWPLHLLHLVDREAPRLKRLRDDDPKLATVIENAYRFSKEESQTLLRRYPSLLDEACKNKGIALDPTSRHPKYTVNDRFFTLDIDETKRMARLSDTEGRLAEFPGDVDAVVENLKREHARVFGRRYNGTDFLKLLRKQYVAILKSEKLVDGAAIPIRSITRRLGKNLKGFRTDEFLVDLSRLAEQGPLQVDKRKLDLQQTKDTSQGMLLHGGAGRGYVGFIVFREDIS